MRKEMGMRAGLSFCSAPALCAALCLTSTTSSWGQLLYGSLVGNVTDPSNAPINGAVVNITHKGTGQSRQTTTNTTGQYNFPTVQSGTYDIRVTTPGFRTYSRTGVEVAVNSVARVDVQMELGAVTETVSVAADAVLLQTDRAEVRHEVTQAALENIPVSPGRNYQQLFNTLPGFSSPRNAHSIPSNPSRSLQFEVNGTVAASNNVRLDGATQYNIWLPHVTAYVPALEAIEAVNVVTGSFDAEQGLAGGAAINVQIKTGTNDLHGVAFWYHNNNQLKAKPFFNPPGERNPKLVFNQPGGTLGGPIIRNKLFFFGSYEGSFDREFAASVQTVPLPEMRAGDMSGSSVPVYDPASTRIENGKLVRDLFPNNIIPNDRIHPVVRKILPLIPAPTSAGISGNYYAQGSYAFDRHTVDTKVNYTGNKITSYVRFSYLDYNANMPTVFGDQLGGAVIKGGNPGHGYGNTYSATAAATYLVSPTFIVDTNFGYTLMNTNVEQPRLDEKIGLDLLGIPGTNGPRRIEGGWPGFDFGSFADLGLTENYMPYFRSDPQYQWVANANWTKGSHNIRFGVELSWQQLNHSQPEFYGGSFGAPGGFQFRAGPTIVPGVTGNQYNEFATFLLGYATQTGKIYQWPDEYSTRTSMQSLYIRDQWQATRKLTLNFGTRWNYFPMPARSDRGLERYFFPGADPAVADRVMVCGIGNQPKDCGVHVSKKLFAPSVGASYRLTDSTVVRAGYGINTDPWNIARAMRTNYPLLTAQTINPSGSFSSYMWATTLTEGIPNLTEPDVGGGIVDLPANVVFNTLDTDFKRGYIQSWNFTLERELWRNFVVQAGYVGTRSVGVMGYEERNYGRIGGGASSRVYYPSTGRNVSLAVVNRLGNTQYDALQITANQRFTSGYQFGLAYTWSKCMGLAGFENSGDRVRIKIPEYYNLNRSLCGIHSPHRFTANGYMELPFGQGNPWANNGIGAAILGGWRVTGLFEAFAGSPFYVSANSNSLNAPESNDQRADLVGPVRILGGAGRGQAWLDWTSFKPVAEARYGTLGYNSILGPGLVNLDAGLFRKFRIAERASVEFRAEAFNVTNTPHFNNPGANISSLRLGPNGEYRGGFGEITGVKNTGREGIDERMFRFGLRFAF
jgi:hypothetical protein